MFPFIPIALGSGAVGAALSVFKKRQPANLVTALTKQESSRESLAIEQVHGELVKVKAEISARISAFEEKYQQFVLTNIDPLLGVTRHAQLQEMLHGKALEIRPEERVANWRIGMGGLTLGVALLGQFVYAPLMGVAIVFGLATVWPLYHLAYLEWQRTRRLGGIHLSCTYVAFLWLGGYASIGALGSFLLGIGYKVKAMAENQSRNNLVDIFQLQPSKVWVRSQEGSEVEIPFEQLQVGDTLVLQAGQIVPVDGTICTGVATVDQHMLTGEAQPVEKSSGDPVLAATRLITGKVDMVVEKTGTDTTAGQIGKILNQTAQYKTKMALTVMELSDRLAVPTFVASAASWPLIGPAAAVSLLGANSTFTTKISGSLAVLNFLNLAATSGVLVKDAIALEELSTVDTVVFDKTGTLTVEQPQVARIHRLGTLSEGEILRLAAAAEARQTHPIAHAILSAANELHLELPAIEPVEYEVGLGLKVWLTEEDKETRRGGDGETEGAGNDSPPATRPSLLAPRPSPLVRVGSLRYMQMEAIAVPACVAELTAACQTNGHSLVMVAVDEQLVGCIELQPTVRPEAKRIVEGLQQRGLALYIISGDQEAPTRKLADDLGMTGYFANVLPEGKADLVEQLQQQGRKVCFIGDGINDAIALRKAAVSISLRGATTVATDTAQIILMEGNLNQLLHLFQLSAEFERNLKRNFRFTAGVSTVALASILFAGFTFAATEVLYTVSLLGGLGIAMQPLLNSPKGKLS